MKKILLLITKSNWGGAQHYVYDLATHLPKEKFSVVVAAGGNGTLLQDCTQEGVQTVTLPSLGRDVSPLKDLQSLREVRELLKKEKPDVLHLNSSKAGFVGALAGRLEKVPRIVFTAHGWSFNEKRPVYQQIVFRIIQGITLLLVDATIAVSKQVQKKAPLKKNIHLVYLGISNITFDDPVRAKEKIKNICPEFNVDTFTIGTIGELHTNKGHDVLVNALTLLPKDKKWQAVIVGEGEERTRLQALIAKYSLDTHVFLAGTIQNGAQLMKAFDIFVLPSRTEALGYALLEAGQAGLPVVASNVGGIPEVIKDGITGVLVTKEDPQNLARALTALMNNSELSHTYGTKNKELVRNTFSLARMVAETVAIYDPTPTNSYRASS